MAQTIRQIITDSLRLLRLLPAGESASGNDAEDCLRHFNDMVLGWKSAGTDITIPAGETESTGAYVDLGMNDLWPYGDQYLGGVKALLAVYIATEWGRIISPQLQQRANDGWTAIQANFDQLHDLEVPPAIRFMPSTWPFGYWLVDET
jgi:hypothetical protein